MHPSLVTVSFSSGVIDSVSCQPYKPQNDSLIFPVGSTQRILYSQLSDMKLQLFDTMHHITTFHLSQSVFSDCYLLPECSFLMTGPSSSPQRAAVHLKVTKPQTLPVPTSHQRFVNGKVQNLIQYTSKTPIFIEETSQLLPHCSLYLQITRDAYVISKEEDVAILEIPFATIERSTCSDVEKERRMYRVVIYYNDSGAYSQKIAFSIFKNELYQTLFSKTPHLSSHKTYRFDHKQNELWAKLSSNDDGVAYLNTNTGRLVSSIPKVPEMKVWTVECVNCSFFFDPCET